MEIRYDRIGKGYNRTRKADPYLADRMYALLGAPTSGLYLDLGCGTGNYTTVLAARGPQFIGIDPSEEMLGKARDRNADIRWIRGQAEDIPLEDASVDGVLATLTLHHWQDVVTGLCEVGRVLRPGGHFVTFTSLPAQTGGYWLAEYWPDMIHDSTLVLPPMALIEEGLAAAGMELTVYEPYFVKPDLQDLFLHSGKFDPERYFDPEFRAGISSFVAFSRQEEVRKGLQKLRKDIDSGRIAEVMRQYENDIGDYLFLAAKHREA